MKKLSKSSQKLGPMLKKLNSIAKHIVKKENKSGIISIVITDDENIRELNKTYRKIDSATDVLSFEMGEDGILGDIIISYETAQRNAKRYGKSLGDEMKRLVVHGVLHLLGFDHKNTYERKKMRLKEDQYAKEIY